MEQLLTPEVLGLGGLGIGGVGVLALLKFVFEMGGVKKVLADSLKEMRETMTSVRDHHKTEEKHHKRVEDLLDRIETNSRPPRPVSGDHTPVRGIEATPPISQ